MFIWNGCQLILYVLRITSIDLKYQIWKFGVVFTDGVSTLLDNTLYYHTQYYMYTFLLPETEIIVPAISL